MPGDYEKLRQAILDALTPEQVGNLLDDPSLRERARLAVYEKLKSAILRELTPAQIEALLKDEQLLAKARATKRCVSKPASPGAAAQPAPPVKQTTFVKTVSPDKPDGAARTTSPMDPRDRVRGAMLGLAAGDALGRTVEGIRDEKKLFSQNGPKGITQYDLDAWDIAEFTDDTQMALFTAVGILAAQTRGMLRGIGGWPHTHVELAYEDWLFTQRHSFPESAALPDHQRNSWLLDVPALYHQREPGRTCLSALSGERPVGAHDYIKHPLNDSKGSGCLVRVAPMGLCAGYENRYKPENTMPFIDKEAATLAALTHGHPLGYMSAAVFAHILHRLVWEKAPMPLRDIVIEARDAVGALFPDNPHFPALREKIDQAIQLGGKHWGSDLNNIHALGTGSTADEALAIAIYCALRYRNDFSSGIIAAVNHRGDSDTTGAATGCILGALLGCEAIDARWKEKLEAVDVILEVADDLASGCQMNEYTTDKDDDWLRKYVHMRWKE